MTTLPDDALVLLDEAIAALPAGTELYNWRGTSTTERYAGPELVKASFKPHPP